MQEYLDLLSEILEDGEPGPDRTGVGTRRLFSRHLTFSLQHDFPIVTTKRIHVHSVIHELIWFLRGDTSIQYLKDHGVRIWNEWADRETGEVGPLYGAQWRRWRAPDGEFVDQIAQVIKSIQTDPYSRRHVVAAWNPGEIPLMALPPCHILFQFFVGARGLSCQMYQRSADVFLGVPFNIVSYAALTHVIASICELDVHELHIVLGDVHLYNNHVDAAKEQLTRVPGSRPRLHLDPRPTRTEDLVELNAEQFVFEGYKWAPAIPAAIAV